MTIPVRATIIPSDMFCSVDGVGFSGFDMASVATNVHAVQWFGTWGEEEIVDLETGRIIRNETIRNLEDYQAVLASYWEIRNTQYAADQEAIGEQTIIEV